MTLWYCGNCHYGNGVNDAYCCNCHRIKDSLASGAGELPPIDITTQPLAPQPSDYRSTYNDKNYGHCKISPPNHLDLDSVSDVGTPAPAQDPHDGRWRKFWFCCNCKDGPHGASNIPACNCGHVHCEDCEMVLLKM